MESKYKWTVQRAAAGLASSQQSMFVCYESENPVGRAASKLRRQQKHVLTCAHQDCDQQQSVQ